MGFSLRGTENVGHGLFPCSICSFVHFPLLHVTTPSDRTRLNLRVSVSQKPPDVSPFLSRIATLSQVLSRHSVVFLSMLCLPYCMKTTYVSVSPTRLSKHGLSQTHRRASINVCWINKQRVLHMWIRSVKSLYFSFFEAEFCHTQICTLAH